MVGVECRRCAGGVPPRALACPSPHHNTEVLQNPVLFDRLEVLKWIAGVVLARACLAGSNPRSSTQIVKLHGASSIQPAPCQVRQGRKAAAVAGRSGVIWVA